MWSTQLLRIMRCNNESHAAVVSRASITCYAWSLHIMRGHYPSRVAVTHHARPLHVTRGSYASRASVTRHVWPLRFTRGRYASRVAVTLHARPLCVTRGCYASGAAVTRHARPLRVTRDCYAHHTMWTGLKTSKTNPNRSCKAKKSSDELDANLQPFQLNVLIAKSKPQLSSLQVLVSLFF